MSHPYKTPEPEQFQVTARLPLVGIAEFKGVRNHHDKPPTSTISVCGVDVTLSTPEEADRFASAALVQAAQLRIAWERAGLLPTVPRQSAHPANPI